MWPPKMGQQVQLLALLQQARRRFMWRQRAYSLHRTMERRCPLPLSRCQRARGGRPAHRLCALALVHHPSRLRKPMRLLRSSRRAAQNPQRSRARALAVVQGRGAGQEPTKSAMVREQAPYRSRNVNGAGSRRWMQTTILAFAVVVRAQCVCIAPRTTTHLVCAVLAAGLPTSQDDKDEIKQMRKELKEAKDEISRLQGELKTKDALMKSEVEKAKAQAEAENQKAVQAAFERGCEFAKSMLK